MISVLKAGKILCEMSDWKMTNLELQKVLYFAHMLYLGEHEGKPLVDQDFEAWEYGPVIPSLYHHLKRYGKGPIGKFAFFWENAKIEDSDAYKCLQIMYEVTKDIPPHRMISISHWEEGAWYKSLIPGKRNVTISDKKIMDEYCARFKPSK